jgi:DNA-binding NtrC family response regulator
MEHKGYRASYNGMEPIVTPQTVLIVEDEVLIRISSAATLEDAGFRTLEVGSSAEALEMLLSNSDITLLMTDVRLPGDMDGLGLVELVSRNHPAIRSMVVSGTTSAIDAGNAGALGFLSKPYMAHSLVLAMNNMVLGIAPLGRAA